MTHEPKSWNPETILAHAERIQAGIRALTDSGLAMAILAAENADDGWKLASLMDEYERRHRAPRKR